MFNFLFGFIWTAFTTLIFIICLTVPGEQRGGSTMTPISISVFNSF